MLSSFGVSFILYCTVQASPHHHHHYYHHHEHPTFHDRPTHHDRPIHQDPHARQQSDEIEYGPSIVSLTKYNKEVYGPTIFRPDAGRTIHLADYPNLSVLVPLAPESATFTSNQIFISRRLSGPGEFHVVAPEGHGVMAVIKSLDLRTVPTEGGCNDFIQFAEVDSGVETTGTCGKLSQADGSLSPQSLIGPRMFLSPSERMKVIFYHGYLRGLVRDFNFDLLDVLNSRNAVLRAEIVFTAYKECNEKSYSENYRPCTKSLGKRTCIQEALFCDKLVHCGFEEDFGSDEYVSNCLPTFLNLLLPRVFAGIRSGSLSNNTTNPKQPPTIQTTTLLTTTTPTSTSTIPTTLSTTTIKTTTSPATTASTTTTTPNPTTAFAFKAFLETQFFNQESSTTETTYPKLIPLETVDINSIRLPPEFMQSTPPQIEEDAPIFTQLNQTQVNMTFSINEADNMLSVEQGEGQVEQLDIKNDINLNGTLSHFSSEEESSQDSLILWIIFSVLILTAAILMLRIYCHNRVVWIPNPKALRVRRKKREFSLHANNANISELHDNSKVKGSVRFKETPPTYDDLFPKSCLHDVDLLP